MAAQNHLLCMSYRGLRSCLFVVFIDSRGAGCEGRSIYESVSHARLFED